MTTAILSLDDLRSAAPSIFATSPWEGMSDRYRHIPTHEVLDMMTDQGFRVTMASQSRTRIPGKAPFTRHMLRMRHVDHLDARGEIPEVVLLNSHDRSSAYKIFTGIMRFVCQNGLVVQAADFGGFSIRHSGSRALHSQISEATATIMDGVPTVMNRIEAWKRIILPRSVQVDFARRAMEIKPNPAINPVFLLTARRDEDATAEDASRDLWTTANVVHEAIMRGGVSGRNGRGRQVSTRSVKAVDANLRINRRLWELAETFSKN